MNKVDLGIIGENLVAEHLNGIRFADPYSRHCDLVDSNGNLVEVKTQVRWRTQNSFTVDMALSNQLKKCLEVDRLIFVEYDSSDNVVLWEAPAKSQRTFNAFTTKYGKNMAGFPISSMKVIQKIYNPQLASKMRSLSSGTL